MKDDDPETRSATFSTLRRPRVYETETGMEKREKKFEPA